MPHCGKHAHLGCASADATEAIGQEWTKMTRIQARQASDQNEGDDYDVCCGHKRVEASAALRSPGENSAQGNDACNGWKVPHAVS